MWESVKYKNLNMIVVAVQDASEEGGLLDPTMSYGISVDINFVW